MRRWLSVLVLGVGCGCGGGGASSPTGAEPAAAPAASTRTIEAVLQDCFTQDVQDAVAFLRSLGTVTRSSPLDGFVLTGIEPVAIRASFRLDADLDGVAEARGTVRFLDADGRPTLPFDLATLGQGTPSSDVFATLPDGTRAEFTFDLLRFVDGAGALTVTFAGGHASTADGSMTLADGGCSSVLRFAGLALPDAPGAFPTGVVTLDAMGGPDRVEGTITFDGTSVAILHGVVNGGAAEDAALDLVTGTFR